MLVTLKPPNYDFEPRGQDLLDPTCRCTHIIYGKSRKYFAKWSGNLSLKTFYGGRAFYDTGLGRYQVNSNQFLVLNERQSYSVTIDSEQKVQSFCIFFESGFAEEVERSLVTDSEKLLDDPFKPVHSKTEFVERLYPKDELVRSFLIGFLQSLKEGHAEEVWIREQLFELMRLMIRVRGNARSEMEKLDAKSFSTREELYKRLYRSRDFIESTYGQKLSLDEMSQIACLSPNHFLRTFKQLFGVTPHQYLTGLRLKEAKTLLAETDLSITNVCLSVGFESLGSFSSLFRNHFHFSPHEFRSQMRKR